MNPDDQQNKGETGTPRARAVDGPGSVSDSRGLCRCASASLRVLRSEPERSPSGGRKTAISRSFTIRRFTAMAQLRPWSARLWAPTGDHSLAHHHHR
jgi:hypothetical protein